MSGLNREDYKDEEVLQTLYDYYKDYYEKHAIKNYPNNFERDYIIFKKWIAGATKKAIGAEHGIGCQRVSAICDLYSRRYSRAKNILQEIKDGKRDPDSMKRYEKYDDRTPTHVTALGLTVRSVNGLSRAGFRDLKDLSNISEEKFREIRNLGDKSCEEIISRMKEFGLEFKPKEIYDAEIAAEEEKKREEAERKAEAARKKEKEEHQRKIKMSVDQVKEMFGVDLDEEASNPFSDEFLEKMKNIKTGFDDFSSDTRRNMKYRTYDSYYNESHNPGVNPYIYDCAKLKVIRTIVNYHEQANEHITYLRTNECSAVSMAFPSEEINNLIMEGNGYIMRLKNQANEIPTIVMDMSSTVYSISPLILGFRIYADLYSFNIRYVIRDGIDRDYAITIAIPSNMKINIMNEINSQFSALCAKYNIGGPVPIGLQIAR